MHARRRPRWPRSGFPSPVSEIAPAQDEAGLASGTVWIVNASVSSAGAGCGSGFFNRRKRVSGWPTSARGVLTSASAAR